MSYFFQKIFQIQIIKKYKNMSINDLFKKGNKLFVEKNLFGGLDVFKEIWLQFPKSKRLEEEINKKIKKFKQPIIQTHSKTEIENFFNLEKLGKSSIFR